MIIIQCDKCIHIPDTQLQIRAEGATIVVECLNCGDMKRLKDEKVEKSK